MSEPIAAPFPWFGGKSMVAAEVWRRFGDVAGFIEPFFGTGAVLLGAPWPSERTETVNDADAFIVNFWRAMQAEPERLAELVDYPVHECSLEARHKYLVESSRKAELAQRCKADPDYYDAKIAGWWCWGICAWIGSGWCSGEWYGEGDERNNGCGINVRDPERGGKRPHLGNTGRGVHRKRPPSKQRPHLSDAGRGVHRKRPPWKQRPHLSNAGTGVHRKSLANGDGHPCSEWFAALAARLRRVRVCCGDWSRICTDGANSHSFPCGVFLDPPYSAEAGRDMDIYSHDSADVAHACREWAIERGDDKRWRIALCGYEGEHDMPDGWTCHEWKANGGFGNFGEPGPGRDNRHRERVWFSRHCREAERGLFDLQGQTQ